MKRAKTAEKKLESSQQKKQKPTETPTGFVQQPKRCCEGCVIQMAQLEKRMDLKMEGLAALIKEQFVKLKGRI